jgi:biotin transport system substrate-specific component
MHPVSPITLSDLVSLDRLRTPVLVLGGALLTAAAAQVSIPLGFTPVPITGQTFAVLLVSAALGWRMAVSSQALYWLMGAVGLPFYADAKSGWSVATGSTFGYFVGFVAAAALVGYLAERGQDRTFATSFTAMSAGTVIIYAFGVGWLAHSLNVPLYSADGKNAFTYGLAPFIVGDLLKMVLAAALTPSAWWFATSRRS